MIIRPCAEFTSDLPEDIIEGDEDFIETGGRSVTEAIAEMLRQFGCTVDPPIYAYDHGWELDVRWRGRSMWCQITLIHRYALITSHGGFLSNNRKKNKTIYADFLSKLNSAPNEDSRFHDIEWYFLKDVVMNLPGAANPVSD
jgi:hypothetical protein